MTSLWNCCSKSGTESKVTSRAMATIFLESSPGWDRVTSTLFVMMMETGRTRLPRPGELSFTILNSLSLHHAASYVPVRVRAAPTLADAEAILKKMSTPSLSKVLKLLLKLCCCFVAISYVSVQRPNGKPLHSNSPAWPTHLTTSRVWQTWEFSICALPSPPSR